MAIDPQNPSASTAIFVVGKIGSGKTTLASSLAPFGFLRVSASKCLVDCYQAELGGQPNRVELANYGHRLLKDSKLHIFHQHLTSELSHENLVVFDGLRFVNSYETIKLLFQKSLVVYLDCPVNVRKRRALSSMDLAVWDALFKHPTELAVEAFKPLSALCLNSDIYKGNAAQRILEMSKM
jgi:dephospho-CoA kinase